MTSGLSSIAAHPGPLEDRIHAIYQELAMAASLRPSARVNHLFEELVALSIAELCPEGSRVLADPIVQAIQESLWRICARGEFELELDWARRILGAGDPWSALRSFPYYENYVRLTQLEALCLRGVSGCAPRSVVFVGCGPLPLTGLLLAADHGIPVTAIDVDCDACGFAGKIAWTLGVDGFRVSQSDALSLGATRPGDVVVLAALVGLRSREKLRLLRHLAGVMPAGALLLVRSARSLRTLLYPEVDPRALDPFEPVIEIHPHDEIINSVIIARAPSIACVPIASAGGASAWEEHGQSAGG